MENESGRSQDYHYRVGQRLSALSEKQTHPRAQPEQPTEFQRQLQDRVRTIERRFALSALEAELLYIMAVHEMDSGFRQSFAILAQGGAFSAIGYVDLATFFENDLEELNAVFAGESALFSWELLQNAEPGGESAQGPFYLDARIRAYLSGSDRPDRRIDRDMQKLAPSESIRQLYLEPALREQVRRLAASWNYSDAWRFAIFSGPAGCGQGEVAAWIATQLQRTIYKIAASETGPELGRTLKLALREAALADAFLIVTDISEEQQHANILNGVLQLACERGIPIILALESQTFSMKGPFLMAQSLAFHLPGVQSRTALWKDALVGHLVNDNVSAAELAARYRLSQNQITNAVRLAVNRAKLREEADVRPPLALSDFSAACRALCQSGLGDLARRVESEFRWDDLILQPDIILHLRQLCAHVRNRDQVYQSWNYKNAHTAAAGVHALFSGPPGTGKTMAASVIANELGLELYRIDLATVVSKYIGETEKNLSRIFEEARNSNSILFFDEADALFGKRSEVKDARDRYANIEVSYLLQKIEEYDGLTILASNMIGNLDDAFRRRLHYIIEFFLPNEQERERLWKLAFTPETPTDGSVDYVFLADKLRLSAAGIKSIALRAALYAAEDKSPLGMPHIMEAVRREFQKEDRPFLEADMSRGSAASRHSAT